MFTGWGWRHDIQPRGIQHNNKLEVVLSKNGSVVMLSVENKPLMLNVIMLNVIGLSVIGLSVIGLRVVAPGMEPIR